MGDHIILDPNHGVNPMMTLCFYCQEPKGLALMGKISHKMKKELEESGVPCGPDGEAPRQMTIDREPCDQCKKYMDMGIILISVDEAKSHGDLQNPYRTGGWCVVAEDYIKRVLGESEICDQILRQRVAFLPDDAWDRVGLPRGSSEEKTDGR